MLYFNSPANCVSSLQAFKVECIAAVRGFVAVSQLSRLSEKDPHEQSLCTDEMPHRTVLCEGSDFTERKLERCSQVWYVNRHDSLLPGSA